MYLTQDEQFNSVIRLDAALKHHTDLEYPEVMRMYSGDKKRIYHNLDHIYYMINKTGRINEWKKKSLIDKEILAIWFHDIIYDPKDDLNELNSIDFLNKHWKSDSDLRIEIGAAVASTIDFKPKNQLGKFLIDLDLAILKEPMGVLIEYEQKIFREFEFVDYDIYKVKRVEVLEKFNTDEFPNVRHLIDYVKNRKVKIGVFAGSFNPFHVGHMNILEKAEKVFDKVIIAYGKNPEKNSESVVIPKALSTKQVDFYDGLLTDYLKSKSYSPVLIRGLRNFTDLAYENNLAQFLKEMMSEIQIVYFICDKKYEHISSSSIKALPKDIMDWWVVK